MGCAPTFTQPSHPRVAPCFAKNPLDADFDMARDIRAVEAAIAAERPDVPYLRPSKLLVALAEADAPLADWEKYV